MPPRTASKSTTRSTSTTRRRAGTINIADHNAAQTTGTTATQLRRKASRVESAIGASPSARKPKATTTGSRVRGAKTGTTAKSTGPSRSAVMHARKGALEALQTLDVGGQARALQWLSDQLGVIPSKR